MSLLQGDTLTQISFSVFENKGVFAVLLGSGLSRSAEIPTGWEITLDLVRKVAKVQGVADQADWAKWYTTTTGKEPNYSDLLEQIASTPGERRSILHSYIEPNEDEREQGKKVPTPAHHAIAALVRGGFIRVIITTNFDRLMENALREQGIEPTVVASKDALKGAEPLTHSQCYLVKLHGDYKDARILNTDSELSAYPPSYKKLLDRIFDEHGLIVCGWSGEWDHALRSAFLRAPNRRYPVYWALRGEAGEGAQALIRHRAAKQVAINGADDFFKGLQQRVETLTQSQRQNPLSMDLLISSTKRYLSKPEYRIQLDDLFADESNRLMNQLDGVGYTGFDDLKQGQFRKLIAGYEAAVEPLARMVSVMGRWADGRDLPMVIGLVRSLDQHANKYGSGITHLLALRHYPAVLIFTAYGLGLTRAERWHDLHSFLRTELPSRGLDARTLVSELFLDVWNGGEDRNWKQLEGLDNKKMPLSTHLLQLMTEWRKSFDGIGIQFPLLMGRFEMIASLAYFESNDADLLEGSIASKANGELLAFMPVGRVAFDFDVQRPLVQELQSASTRKLLLDAGFSQGSERKLELFFENFSRYCQWVKWKR
ncbi:hypothetical protein B9Z45_02970 [Limnohabitans sp. 2KL-17]|uniref:SIR2 family protein n=1 Tax=Limnohabitans sp. 2KL-17 TaxID=1100704 RepID=UPI000D336A90|nr:SIR2 family protein [Limnohabitans sp. 2KL-17]PUE62783.1 hypothetical protein B9Z45_02970 [Limnohabitans sp. 2KL-17]